MDTDDRILTAACKVFSQKGFRGSSVKEIANKARVNEVTIFRKYPRKEDLINAVIERSVFVRITPDSIARLMHLPPLEFFTKVAEFTYEERFQNEETYRLLLYAALESPEAARRISDSGMLYFDRITEYYQKRIEDGRLRKIGDSVVVPRMISYMVHGHCFFARLLNMTPDVEYDTVIKAIVTVLMEGITVRTGEPGAAG